MSKAPAFQFYPGDYMQDTRLLSLEGRGAWVDLLCLMWRSSERGRVTATPDEFARLFGCKKEQAQRVMKELQNQHICDFESSSNGDVTLICRRMVREEAQRTSGASRSQKLREKGGGDPDKWAATRIRILQMDEYMCAYCGRKADTVDHILPKMRGGDESDKNLVACCKRCNMVKNNRTPEEAGFSMWAGFKRKHVCNTLVTPPSSSSSSSSSKRIKTFTSDAPAFRLSELLLSLIQERDPKITADLQKSAIHIDLLMRLDKRSPEEVESVIRWCQDDAFWKTNVLSTKKLREKFPTLWQKMEAKHVMGADQGSHPREPAKPIIVKTKTGWAKRTEDGGLVPCDAPEKGPDAR